MPLFRIHNNTILTKTSSDLIEPPVWLGVKMLISCMHKGVFRHLVGITNKTDTQSWELPGGHVENGETLYDGASREGIEEYGVDTMRLVQERVACIVAIYEHHVFDLDMLIGKVITIHLDMQESMASIFTLMDTDENQGIEFLTSQELSRIDTLYGHHDIHLDIREGMRELDNSLVTYKGVHYGQAASGLYLPEWILDK